MRRSIYSENTLWLGIEEQGEIVACGALLLDYGRPVDQIGEMGRLAVHPSMVKHGFARRIIEVLSKESGANVEMTCGYARTAHPISQTLMDDAAFSPIGFLPLRWIVCERQESGVIYGKLSDSALQMRCADKPHVIPEIRELALHSLKAFRIPESLQVVTNCGGLPEESFCQIQPLKTAAIPQLMRIELGRVTRPMVFGNTSLEYGLLATSRRETKYFMAVDRNQTALGAIGYQLDKGTHAVSIVELFAEHEDIAGHLVRHAIRGLSGNKIIEVNVSAYEPRLQQTFWDHGFRPTMYAPSHAFQHTQRLDVIKMYKLNVPYQPNDMKLTEKASVIASLVGKCFPVATALPQVDSREMLTRSSLIAPDRLQRRDQADHSVSNNKSPEHVSGIQDCESDRAQSRERRTLDSGDEQLRPSPLRGRRISMLLNPQPPVIDVDESAIWFPSFD